MGFEQKYQGQKIKTFRVFDIFLCLAVLFLAVIIFIISFRAEKAEYFIVSCDGEEQRYRMDKAEEYEFISNGIHVKVVSDGETVRVTSSECPDKICVNTGKISRKGQMIVCSPAHFSVRIEGEGEADGVTG